LAAGRADDDPLGGGASRGGEAHNGTRLHFGKNSTRLCTIFSALGLEF